jgi:prevent-host-death family protein
MRFVSVRELRNRPGKLWASLSKADVVLTSNGKPMGVLVGVDEARLDETIDAIRRAKAAMAVSRMRKRAAESGISRLTMAEINREVREVRRKRRPA